MSTIQTTATFPNIPAEKLGEFKELAEQMMAVTRTEADTLQYDWFFNDDETKCVVRETYASSDAVLAHVANLGDLFERIVEVGGHMEIEGFGTPSAELLAMTDAMNATVYAPFLSK
jgi:quinol monooxygenase YgiN